MGRQRPTSGKRQREADKAAKAKAKRERRQGTEPDGEAVPTAADELVGVSSSVVLERLADAHRRFQNAEISFEEYDETKAALLRQLRVD